MCTDAELTDGPTVYNFMRLGEILYQRFSKFFPGGVSLRLKPAIRDTRNFSVLMLDEETGRERAKQMYLESVTNPVRKFS